MGSQQSTRRVSFQREQSGKIAVSEVVAEKLQQAATTVRGEDPTPSKTGKTADVRYASHFLPTHRHERLAGHKPTAGSHHAATDENVPPADSKKTGSSQFNTEFEVPSEFLDAELGTASGFRPQFAMGLVPEGSYYKALSSLDKKWQERYHELAENSHQLILTSTDELNRTVAHVEHCLCPRPMPVRNPCLTLRTEVLECYDDNTSRSILCHKKAREFASCVDKYRLEFLRRYE